MEVVSTSFVIIRLRPLSVYRHADLDKAATDKLSRYTAEKSLHIRIRKDVEFEVFQHLSLKPLYRIGISNKYSRYVFSLM